MNVSCSNYSVCYIRLQGTYTDLRLDGYFMGTIDGTVSDGTIINGYFCGTIGGVQICGIVNITIGNGFITGYICGTVNGEEVCGYVSIAIDGNTINGWLNGKITGTFTGDLNGIYNGTINGLPTNSNNPFFNLTTEDPDEPVQWIYPPSQPNAPLSFCEVTPDATICNPTGGGTGGVPGTPNPGPTYYPNAAQTCTVTCPDTSEVSITVPEGWIRSVTQSLANALAYEEACSRTQIVCDGGDEPVDDFDNVEQTCTADCGTSYTTPAGLFSRPTQEEADAAAYAFACQLAQIQCPVPPITPSTPFPPGGGGGGTGSGTAPGSGGIAPPTNPPGGGGGSPPGSGGTGPGAGGGTAPGLNPVLSFTNTTQTCTVDCGDGTGTFTATVAASTFSAASPTLANQIAYAQACQNAETNKFCITGEDSNWCVDEASETQFTIGASGATVSIIGTLPSGLTLSQVNATTYKISGTPSAAGTSTVVIRATTSNGYASLEVDLIVSQITTAAALPDATEDEPYSQFIAVSNFTEAFWALHDGSLPDGIELDQETGELHGEPTTVDSYAFAISVLGANGESCIKDFTLEVINDAVVTHGYMSGGLAGSPAGFVTDNTYKLDFLTDTSTLEGTAALSEARTEAGGASNGLIGYVSGGAIPLGPDFYKDTTDSIDYSSDTTSAEPSANLSGDRAALAGMGDADDAYMCGGTDGATIKDTVDVISFSGGTSSIGNPLPTETNLNAAIMGDTSGYILGGNDNLNSRNNYIFKLNVAAGTWSTSPSVLTEATRGATGATGNTTKGFVCGGNCAVSDALADKLVFASDTISTVPGALISQFTSELAGNGNSANSFYSGGDISGGRTDIINKLDLTTETMSIIAATLSSPTGGIAGV
jgi:hypothetical protein